MAFFCPIFGGRSNKAAEYEDSEYFSVEATSRTLNPSRSLSALHHGQSGSLDKHDQLKPHTRICITDDFQPTVDDEVDVKRGDIVTAVYKDQDWVYVVKDGDGKEGFVPRIFCSKITLNSNQKKCLESPVLKSVASNGNGGYQKSGNKFRFGSGRSRSLGRKAKQLQQLQEQQQQNSHQTKYSNRPTSPKALENINRFLQSLDETSVIPTESIGHYESEFHLDRTRNDITVRQSTSYRNRELNNCKLVPSNDVAQIQVEQQRNEPPCTVFVKKPQGYYVALYRFEASVEDDVGVEAGDLLTVLNKEDPDWYWVKAPNSAEGFVPSNYIVPFEIDNASLQSGTNADEYVVGQTQKDTTANFTGMSQGCELLVVEDVVPEAADDLQLKKGDWILSCQSLDSLVCQENGGWLWGYCPRTERYGFVRRSATQLPNATIL